MQSTPWTTLTQHAQQLRAIQLPALFRQDPERFTSFSLEAAGLLLDYSKNHITQETMDHLVALATASQLQQKRMDLFEGARINQTENRAALHTALRHPQPPLPVQEALAQMTRLVESIHQDTWFSGRSRKITDVVHIGVGGSYLGPALAVEALAPFAIHTLRCHFLPSVDPVMLHQTMAKLDRQHTLFIVASKTFTTAETCLAAEFAKAWLIDDAQIGERWPEHMIAVTANADQAHAFGIPREHILPLWDWVGGRFSLWSTMGLPVALTVGIENFKRLLAGAHAMDHHFQTASFTQNMPILLGLLSIWYINFMQAPTHAIVPYLSQLRLLTPYLQQLSMESNGKSTRKNGECVVYATAPIVWGGFGTEGQHAYHQLLFQGTHCVPTDFIVAVNGNLNDRKHHDFLIANCFAQSRALMEGQFISTSDQAAPHRTIAGNQPSNTLLMTELNPYTLGTLLALYEHKTFVESVIWDINCFDQWGVELGKMMAHDMMHRLRTEKTESAVDHSTQGLLDYYKKHVR